MTQKEIIEKMAEAIRIQLIGSMDLFMEWGKRSYKNTNNLKHEDTSKIIGTMAKRIATHLFNQGIRSVEGFEIWHHVTISKIDGTSKATDKITPKDFKE